MTLEVDLAVAGMTCASCVARVEKRLNRVEGVTATVNLPLETAHLVLTQPVNDAELIAAVERAGYQATVSRRREPVTAPAEAPRTAAPPQTPAPDAAPEPPTTSAEAVPAASPADPLRNRLLVAAMLAVPVVALSMVPAWQFDGWQWLVAALALPVVTWAAWPFHVAAFRAARHGASTMDTLVSLGVIAATAWSLWALLWGGAGEPGMRMNPTLIPARGHAGSMPELYFEVATVVTTFLLAGRYAESRSKRRAGDALRALLELGAKEAERVLLTPQGHPATGPDGLPRTERIAASALQVGDLFWVRPGEKIATDGEVVEGSSALDTSLLTGEPVPVDVGPGDQVTGATLNTSGSLLVRATRVGDATTFAQIGQLVARAQTGKAPVQRLADRISAVFVPVVLIIAIVTLAVWLLTGAAVATAFTAAVAVLIIACPCALGLATPTALLVGSGRGAQLGILIKGPEILESTRRVDTIVLDKTGTVTEGAMRLESVIVADDDPDGSLAREALALAAAVESHSEHPIAHAIVAAARAQVEYEADGAAIGSLHAFDFRSVPGGGVEAVIRKARSDLSLTAQRVVIGQPAWLETVDTDLPPALADAFGTAEDDGGTAVVAGWAGTARAVLVLRDPVKVTSAAAVTELRDLGLRPYLLTGDGEGAALHAARAVGIAESDVIARVLPDQKVATVTGLAADGKVVAMVGDGVNDAAALATADLGLAMGTGTDVAIEASDITLVRGDLRSAATAIRLSRRTLRVIKQNLFWAFAYNVAAIPLAATGLLNPMIAGAAMAASSVLVVSNSLRLRSTS